MCSSDYLGLRGACCRASSGWAHLGLLKVRRQALKPCPGSSAPEEDGGLHLAFSAFSQNSTHPYTPTTRSQPKPFPAYTLKHSTASIFKSSSALISARKQYLAARLRSCCPPSPRHCLSSQTSTLSVHRVTRSHLHEGQNHPVECCCVMALGPSRGRRLRYLSSAVRWHLSDLQISRR